MAFSLSGRFGCWLVQRCQRVWGSVSAPRPGLRKVFLPTETVDDAGSCSTQRVDCRCVAGVTTPLRNGRTMVARDRVCDLDADGVAANDPLGPLAMADDSRDEYSIGTYVRYCQGGCGLTQGLLKVPDGVFHPEPSFPRKRGSSRSLCWECSGFRLSPE